MNYSEPLISQVSIFFRAAGCGIILGILYDAISLVRMLFGERKGVYVFFDTLYFLVAAVISFFFMVLYNSGQVRLNLMLAEGAGAIAFHFSLGRYILQGFASELVRIKKILSFVAVPFVKTSGMVYLFLKRTGITFIERISFRKNIKK